MDFTGPIQRWQIWIDVESSEPRDRAAGEEHKNVDVGDLLRAARVATTAVQNDPRLTVTRVHVQRDEDER